MVHRPAKLYSVRILQMMLICWLEMSLGLLLGARRKGGVLRSQREKVSFHAAELC